MPAPLLRVVRPASPCVVLGPAQAWPEAPAALPVRRRASGGTAVLEGPWLLRATVVLPRAHAALRQGVTGAAAWYGRLHLDWLLSRGVDGATLYDGPAIAGWACFGARARGEVLVRGRKIVGIAQAWRGRAVLLSAGTLLAPPPWVLLCDALGRAAAEAAQLEADTVSVAQCTARALDGEDWTAALRAALEPALQGAVRPRDGEAA